ncbi:uncharacterized protein SOCE26_032720 [Sorangium cellulosum]|uniref:AAA+ ATPase domain-containing protein n=1 Tax=Sorangium cellulosum TaxID=56 RepID=A0A2L0ERA5_SORCE|nr:ATP-binding protein [Sorangium cellulosum]AUX41847.1 uncharacterized protein SOCE26_032720 [Sorangium cellulosum]
MIETVHFQNFKALRDLTVLLDRFTVLVGPNASGKTSVLEGLAYVHRCRAHPTEPRWPFRGAGDPSALCSRGGPDSFRIRCEGARDQDRLIVSLAVELLGDGPWDPWHWSFEAHHRGEVVRLPQSREPDPSESAVLDAAVPSVAFLRLDAKRLAEPAYSDALVPEIGPDGAGLAAVLAEMLISRAEDFRRVERALAAVVPSVERIRLERAPVRRVEQHRISIDGTSTMSAIEREYVGHRVVFDMRGAPSLPAHAASEGTLVALGLLTAIVSRSGPHLVLIDDLERAVHPKALIDLVDQLRALLDLFPGLQIVATSHSPYLVDLFEPREVRMTMMDERGSTLCARIDEHPEFERWRAFMAPGEIWSMIGEEWVRDRAVGAHG